jgi:CBS-domain-containing membrane protein
MFAAGAVETLPGARLDDDALSAVRLALRRGLPGLVAADERGEVVDCLSWVDLIRLVLPGYVRGEPRLARTFDEEHADRIAATLVGTRVRDVIGGPRTRAPTARPQATAVELAELMARHRCPLVLVENQAGGILGIVTASHLLELLVAAAEPSR